MNQTQSIQMQQKQGQILRIEQASLLEMPEDNSHNLVRGIEQSSLFKKLYHREKLIRYQRIPRTDIDSTFYEIKEDMASPQKAPDMFLIESP